MLLIGPINPNTSAIIWKSLVYSLNESNVEKLMKLRRNLDQKWIIMEWHEIWRWPVQRLKKWWIEHLQISAQIQFKILALIIISWKFLPKQFTTKREMFLSLSFLMGILLVNFISSQKQMPFTRSTISLLKLLPPRKISLTLELQKRMINMDGPCQGKFIICKQVKPERSFETVLGVLLAFKRLLILVPWKGLNLTIGFSTGIITHNK